MTEPDSTAGKRPSDFALSDNFVYPGRELEGMDCASNYHEWILARFKPFLGKRLVEVGAGLGSFSRLILSQHVCQTLSLVEPSKEMFEKLSAIAGGLDTAAQIHTYQGTFLQSAAMISARCAPDSIIYVNVLEHIAEDERELEIIYQTLVDHGRAFLFVPALPRLYGAFDERLGHLRRYTKPELEGKLERAGFKLLLSTYFDLPGIAPWWIKYCLLKSASMEPRGVRLYDRFIVPAARRLESFITPPLGKSLIVVAEKR